MKKYLTLLCLFAIVEISLALYLTMWREHFWNAVSLKQSNEFIQQLSIFTGVALVICFVSGVSGYLVSLTAIKWREKLNVQAVTISTVICDNCSGSGQDVERPDSWRCYPCNGLGSVPNTQIENLNQRIQEDCLSYPDLVLNLLFGTTKAILYILVFSVSLLMTFSWMYLCILVAYALIGSALTNYIARPLIQLNYEQQRAEASYRNSLTITNFADCVVIMLGLAKKQKHLTYFQQFYGQLGVVIPLIIIAPVYFTTGMNLGHLMRFNSLGGTILDNMSYGITSFANINKLLSCKKRLREAQII